MKNGKHDIRYVGFACTAGGGRRIDFSMGVPGQESAVSVDISAPLFLGTDRIMLQECAGICLSKIRKLFEIDDPDISPLKLCLTTTDVTHYRDLQPAAGRRRSRIVRPVT